MKPIQLQPEGGRPDEVYEVSRMLAGADLGQSTDYSALAIVRQQIGTKIAEARRGGWWSESRLPNDQRRYTIQHLSRWELGTPYTTVAADLAELVTQIRAASRWIGSPRADPPHTGTVTVAYDQTGLGAPVGDLLRSAGVRATGIIIGSGQADSVQARTGAIAVPKESLLTNLLVLMEQGRLKAESPDLADLDTLMAEMTAYTRRQTPAGGQTFDSTGHSDLLMALAIACYAGRLADQAEAAQTARRAISNAFRR